MFKNHFAININDEQFLLLNSKKKKILTKRFQSLKEDQIMNVSLFKKELYQFLKENKIPISLFGYKLTFIKPSSLNEVLVEKYLEIFSDYFRKIEVKNIEEVLNMEKNDSFLNINKNYIDYYYQKKNKLEILRIKTNIFKQNTNKIIHYFFTTIYKPQKVVVFGNDTAIPSITEKLDKEYNILATFPEYHQKYLLEEYKKN